MEVVWGILIDGLVLVLGLIVPPDNFHNNTFKNYDVIKSSKHYIRKWLCMAIFTQSQALARQSMTGLPA